MTLLLVFELVVSDTLGFSVTRTSSGIFGVSTTPLLLNRLSNVDLLALRLLLSFEAFLLGTNLSAGTDLIAVGSEGVAFCVRREPSPALPSEPPAAELLLRPCGFEEPGLGSPSGS